MHCFSDTVFTTTSLAKKFDDIQKGAAIRRPTPAAFLPVFHRLSPDMVSTQEVPNLTGRQCTEAQITSDGRRGVGYAAFLLGLCLDNRKLAPRSVMGNGVDLAPLEQQFPANRFGLYGLLSTTDESFFTPEITHALKLKNTASAYNLIRGAELAGIVVRERSEQKDSRGNVLYGIQFSNAYSDVFGGFVEDIRLLSTDDGIDAGIKRAETIVDNPEDFAYLASLVPRGAQS